MHKNYLCICKSHVMPTRFKTTRRRKGYRRSARRMVARTARKGLRRQIYAPRRKGPGSTSIVPDTYRVKLRYVTGYVFTGANNLIQFRGNSVFDPDFTSAGSQPNGFDQLAAMFTRYRVMGSSIKVKIIPITTGQAGSAYITLFPSNESSIAGSTSALINGGESYAKTAVTIGNNITFMKHYFTTRKMRGDRNAPQDAVYTALVNANPSQNWYWNFIASATDGSTVQTSSALFELTYYVEFYDRITQNAS